MSESKPLNAIKKVLAAGVGAAFLTEEAIRDAVADLKLPKEALSSLVAQANGTRAELFKAVQKELRKYLRQQDLEKLLGKVLEHFTVEVKAEIRFKPKPKDPQ